ncbi:MAG: helix-hairpin-helix domain-containing protein [Succinivibrionaceae bacterium]
MPGIGPKKRQSLLNRFGGLAEIISASREEIAKTEGIGEALSEIIYRSLHEME